MLALPRSSLTFATDRRRTGAAAIWALVACCGVGSSRGQESLPSPDGPAAVSLPAGPSAGPMPTIGEPPPMYIADPLAAGGYAGIPTTDMFPNWPRWFAGASGLVMTRSLPGGAATMRPLNGVQLSTSDAGANWPGGVDLHIGRWFGERQHHAVEFIYWGVYGIGSSAAVTADGIRAIPQAPGVTVGTATATDYLLDSSRQVISRSDLINDVEINWVYSLWDRPEFLSTDPSAPSRPISLMWLVGFRFFELQDVLTLTSVPGGAAPGVLDLNVATNNNLFGAQVGAKFDWRFLPRVRFSTVPKIMIAGNSITNTTTLASGSGTPALFAGGAPVNVHATQGVFSWLGSVDAGVAWDVTDHWTLSMGYRVVGVGNIAQADGQWPAEIAGPGSLSAIDSGSSTIIQGGFAGFEGRY
jgi:hypothetical protein